MRSEAQIIPQLIQLGIPVVLLIAGYFTGRAVEKRHYKRLAIAEQEFAGILVSTMKNFPPGWTAENPGELVIGSVVIATDYFKVFMSWFHNLFGGNLTEFETLLERGRREAVVRMLRQAQASGANVVWNMRFYTVFMGDTQRRQSTGAEICAYGTAYRVK
ncbi:MAG: YbjQ family protein [Candidatus Sumerlaeaceae bacterium]